LLSEVRSPLVDIDGDGDGDVDLDEPTLTIAPALFVGAALSFQGIRPSKVSPMCPVCFVT
jgi:hypothetical protein